MEWKLRDDDNSDIPYGRNVPYYGPDSGYFTIIMHHSGKFLRNLGSTVYFGGEIAYFDFCHEDKLSMVEMRNMLKELRLVGDFSFYFSTTGVNCSFGVRLMQSDIDALSLVNYVDESRMVGIFLINETTSDDESAYSTLPSVDAGMVFVSNEDVQSLETEVETHVHDEPLVPPAEVAEVIGNSDSDSEQSCGSDSDHEDVFFDSECEVSDDDVLFEANIDAEVEWGANMSVVESEPTQTQPQTQTRSMTKNLQSKGKEIESTIKRRHMGFNEKLDMDNPMFYLGQEFANIELFKKAIRQHSIVSGRDVDFTINDTYKVQARCSHKTCPWIIYGSSSKANDTVVVRTLKFKHQCPRQQAVKHANARWLAEKYKNKIWSDPTWPVDSMMAVMQDDVKLTFNKHQMYKTKKIVFSKGSGNDAEEYALLWSYAEELKRSNPENTVKIKCKLDGGSPRFKRFYMCWGALKKGMLQGCRRFICMDGCHLKNSCGGILLCVVSVDSNNCMFPFAYAVVEKEKRKTWLWFIALLIDDLQIRNSYSWTIMSDKQKGLVEAVEELLPRTEHRFCVMHLYKNFNLNYKGLALKLLMWKAARATRVVDFEKAVAEIKDRDLDAHDWLAQRPPSQCSKSHYSPHSKCDIQLNNIAESFNSLILKARNKPIVSMLETIRLLLMKRIHIRRDQMIKYTGGDICPKIDKILEMLKKKSMGFAAHWNGRDQFEIEGCNGQRFKLHLGNKSCSCRRWEISGIPCAHAITGMYYLGHKPEDYIDDCYKRDTFMKAYSFFMSTIDGRDMWPKSIVLPIIPPKMTKLPGRPKKHKRRRDANEIESSTSVRLSKRGVVMTCSLCNQPNHNARTCPTRKDKQQQQDRAPIPPPITDHAPQEQQAKKSKTNAKSKSKAQAINTTTEQNTTPTRSIRTSIMSQDFHSPARNIRSLAQTPNEPSTSITKKSLGLRKKLPIKKLMQRTDMTMTSSQMSTTLSKPWVPPGRTLTEGVRFSTKSSGRNID